MLAPTAYSKRPRSRRMPVSQSLSGSQVRYHKQDRRRRASAPALECCLLRTAVPAVHIFGDPGTTAEAGRRLRVPRPREGVTVMARSQPMMPPIAIDPADARNDAKSIARLRCAMSLPHAGAWLSQLKPSRLRNQHIVVVLMPSPFARKLLHPVGFCQ